MDELPNCPFCGSPAVKEQTGGIKNSDGDTYWVGCPNDDCIMEGEKMCRSLWENRAPDPRVDQLEAALRYAISEADEWHDDSHGGRIDTPEMDQARKILEAK